MYEHLARPPIDSLRRIRVPFYWEARTVFLLFLSLPQTQVRERRNKPPSYVALP